MSKSSVLVYVCVCTPFPQNVLKYYQIVQDLYSLALRAPIFLCSLGGDLPSAWQFLKYRDPDKFTQTILLIFTHELHGALNVPPY